jgi:hypothetical protein
VTWFDQVKQALPGYYRADRPADIVGYLRGSSNSMIWRQMEQGPRPRNQMLILGNTDPTREEWIAAGVEQRGESQVVRFLALNGFIVLYAGFMLRPWGRIHTTTHDALTIGFPGSLNDWRRNYRPPRP